MPPSAHGVHLGLLAVRSMPEGTSGDDALRASLREVGRADGISAVRRLSGGVIADAWLIGWADGTSAVGKIVNGAAPDLFRTEADGLAALRGTGHLATPDVLAVTDRLPELIPPMPAVLTHGDLWTGNLVSQPGGRITVIDPAVSYTWAEVDLSMLWGNPRPPASDRFFAAYQELNPSPPGWAERMPVLHLRELLSSIAHFGPAASYDLGRVRDTLSPFYQR